MKYDNTVGSRTRRVITWSREIRELQKRLFLTPTQEQMLIGTLLGDGCLLNNRYKGYRLAITQGSRQKDYLYWKYENFREWFISQPKYQSVTDSWRARTISHPVFNEFHKLFYRFNKKRVPININKLLVHPLSLAVWYMDDGGVMRDGDIKRGMILNTQQFSISELKRLQSTLVNNFSIPTTRQWNNSGYRLYVGRKHCNHFSFLIKDYIHPTLFYKLVLTP